MSSSNMEDHSTVAEIFTTIDDNTRVIPAVEFRNVKFAYGDQIVRVFSATQCPFETGNRPGQ